MNATRGPEIVGRDREVRAATEFVADVASGPAALVISGEAGIGKTELWRFVVREARTRGCTVLTTRPAEEEMLGALTGLVDLLELSDVDASVLDPDIDAFRRSRRLLASIRGLASKTPVVVAIDDLQWLDVDTRRTLSYTFRRLDEEQVRLVATWRTEGVDDAPVSPLSVPHALATRLDLEPLTVTELRHLLADRWGKVSPLTLRTIHRVSAGNPLYAIELARSMTGDERSIGMTDGVRLPESLQGAIERRLDTVGTELRDLLELVAVAGPSTINALQEQLPEVDVGSAFDRAADLGLLSTDEQMRIRFAHPMLSSAVEQRINPVAARQLHTNLAAVATDLRVRARHLALSTDQPDPDVAALLEAAAREARNRGAVGMAAGFARHSRRLTPAHDSEAGRRRTLLQVSALASGGEISRARSIVDRLIDECEPGTGRAEALLARFYVENDDVELGDATLVQALQEAEGDALLTGRVLDLLGWHRGVFRGDLRSGIEAAREAVEVLRATNDESLLTWARGHLAHLEALRGSPQLELMEELASVFQAKRGPDLGGGPSAWLAKQLLWAGDLARAKQQLDEVMAAYAVRGFEIGRPYRLYDAALLGIVSGELHDAEQYVRQGMTAADDAENADIQGWLLYPQGLVEAWLGRSDEAVETAARLMAYPGRPGHALGRARALSVLGVNALSRAEFNEAAEVLTQAVDIADDIGLGHPGALPVLPDAVIALAAADQVDRARKALAQLSAQADQLDLEYVWAMVGHARGCLAGAEGDFDRADELLNGAQDVFGRLGCRPRAARCGFELGRVAMRAGRRTLAADRFDSAMRSFAEMGATGWAAAARRELERVSAGRAEGILTEAESRIAALVSAGSTNREIASSLFVSVATVEAHLTRVYRKLDIRSRTELTRMVLSGEVEIVLGDGDGDEAAP